jgi:hypothetical protein
MRNRLKMLRILTSVNHFMNLVLVKQESNINLKVVDLLHRTTSEERHWSFRLWRCTARDAVDIGLRKRTLSISVIFGRRKLIVAD